MPKYFHLFLFLLFSLSSHSISAAKTEQIDNLDKMFVYLEPDSIRKSNQIVSYWIIFDLKNEQKYYDKPVKSISSEIRANCNSKKIDSVLSVFFTGNMGKGKFLIAEPNQKFDFEIPNTLLEKYTTIVCNKS